MDPLISYILQFHNRSHRPIEHHNRNVTRHILQKKVTFSGEESTFTGSFFSSAKSPLSVNFRCGNFFSITISVKKAWTVCVEAKTALLALKESFSAAESHFFVALQCSNVHGVNHVSVMVSNQMVGPTIFRLKLWGYVI